MSRGRPVLLATTCRVRSRPARAAVLDGPQAAVGQQRHDRRIARPPPRQLLGRSPGAAARARPRRHHLRPDPLDHLRSERLRRLSGRLPGVPTDCTGFEAISPRPGRSAAITRKRSLSATTVGRNEPLVAPSPCTATTAGPLPASIVENRTRRFATIRKRRRPGPVKPLVAARNPTPRCGFRRTLSRPER